MPSEFKDYAQCLVFSVFLYVILLYGLLSNNGLFGNLFFGGIIGYITTHIIYKIEKF